MPASLASVSGAKPVQPDMPMRDLGLLRRGRRERGTGEARERDERSRSQQ